MRTPEDKRPPMVAGPNFLASWFIYDYEICRSQAELQRTIEHINHHGYDLTSVTQDMYGTYTVFFRRRACG